jgi:AcrR family transcriptional regulator
MARVANPRSHDARVQARKARRNEDWRGPRRCSQRELYATCSQCQHDPVNATKAGYHHGDLRNALVAEAVAMVEAGDVETFSLREVARRVGVSANATYRHFDDKASLLVAVTRAGFEIMAARMRDSLRDAGSVRELAGGGGTRPRSTKTGRNAAPPKGATGQPATRRLRAVGRAYIEFALAHPALFRAMFGPHGVRSLVPRAREEAEGEAAASPYQLLLAALGDMVEEGLIGRGAADEAAFQAWVVVHGCTTLVLEGAVQLGDTKAREARIEGLLDFAIRGLVGHVAPREEAPETRTVRRRGADSVSSRSPTSR